MNKLVGAIVMLVPAIAAAEIPGKFGGFSENGSSFLIGKSDVCKFASPTEDAEDPDCTTVKDKAALAAHKFKATKNVKSLKVGDYTVTTTVARGKGEVFMSGTVIAKAKSGTKILARFETMDGDISKVTGMWASLDGSKLVVEYGALPGNGMGPYTSAVGIDVSSLQPSK